MNWGRIKTIFIIIFLIVDLALGGTYFYLNYQDIEYAKEARDNVVSYAKEEGISLGFELSIDQPSLETLVVTLVEGEGDKQYTAKETFPVVVTGKDGLSCEIESAGENKRKVDSASRALIKLLQSIPKEEREKGIEVVSCELVYWVELSEGSAANQKNTAIPSWLFKTADGKEYIFRAYSL